MQKYKIAVFAKHTSEEAQKYAYSIYTEYLKTLTDFHTVSLDPEEGEYDIVIVFGGDGTVLHAANFIHEESVIIGFNMGTLGFLTPWNKKDATEVIKKYLYESSKSFEDVLLEFRMQKSHSIKGFLWRRDASTYDGVDFGYKVYLPRAINEYVIRNKHANRMVHLKCTIDNKTATEYHADALIISTALGSTAYSLAAGGSILEPHLNNFTLVPVAPHALTHRPLVISSSNKIRLEFMSDVSVMIDGKEIDMDFEENQKPKELILEDALCPITMVQPKGFNIYTVLNKKFRWGQRG